MRALVIAIVVLAAGVARGEPADQVALLPLDAGKSLEIYGQPVASEIARALVAGNVDVVVVGPRMAVPASARLIIDGTIAAGKASAVTISLRVRLTADGHVLDTLQATAPGLAKIDGAAAELSARVLPLVRDRLASLRKPAAEHGEVHASAPPPAPAVDRPLLIATHIVRAPDAALRDALDAQLVPWAAEHHRTLQRHDASALLGPKSPAAVAGAHADLAVAFWILAYAPEAGELPMARARVRVRISDATAVVFDRVIATDTVLGDKGLAPAALAQRVAREVLAILRPHLTRSAPSWR